MNRTPSELLPESRRPPVSLLSASRTLLSAVSPSGAVRAVQGHAGPRGVHGGHHPEVQHGQPRRPGRCLLAAEQQETPGGVAITPKPRRDHVATLKKTAPRGDPSSLLSEGRRGLFASGH